MRSSGVWQSRGSWGWIVFCQYTHDRVANSTSAKDSYCWEEMSSVLHKPLTVWASALSQESPTALVDASIPSSASVSLQTNQTYWEP